MINGFTQVLTMSEIKVFVLSFIFSKKSNSARVCKLMRTTVNV